MLVQRFESGLELGVAILETYGLDGIAPGGGLAEDVFEPDDFARYHLPHPSGHPGMADMILAAKPGYAGARIALAGLLAKSGDADGAIRELREVSQQNAAVLEQIGDIEAGRGHQAEARVAYTSALAATSDRAAEKRINGKLRR